MVTKDRRIKKIKVLFDDFTAAIDYEDMFKALMNEADFEVRLKFTDLEVFEKFKVDINDLYPNDENGVIQLEYQRFQTLEFNPEEPIKKTMVHVITEDKFRGDLKKTMLR